MFCAPVTYFSRNQYDAIQRPFINTLLPKLRLNRHTKRAIIWGPSKYGGLQIKDMYVEQLSRTVQQFVAHIRSDSAVGKTMKISVDAYQLLIGSSKPFMELNPCRFPYRPDSKHTKITFLWEHLHGINATLKIADQWLPTLRYHNDIAIMDAVLEAQTKAVGTASFIPNQHIVYANACWLWLKATVLSDITDEVGNNIRPCMMDGSEKCKHDITYPMQENPPPVAWREWRMAIRQSFLGQTTTPTRLPLMNPLCTRITPTTQFTWTPMPALRGAPLK